jgi:hypothetical protein
MVETPAETGGFLRACFEKVYLAIMNIKDMFWYPPAETSLSKKAITAGMSGQAPEFSKELSSYLRVPRLVLGDSGRVCLQSC